MTSDRVVRLVIVACVLLVAWFVASRETLVFGICVAIVALAAAYWRAVLGIPVALGMAAAAMAVPGVAVAALVVVVLLAIVSGFVRMAFGSGAYRPGNVSPTDGSYGYGFSDGGGGWCGDGGGGFDGGGCS